MLSASPQAAAPAGCWRNGSWMAKRRSISGSSISGASPACIATGNGCCDRTLEAYGKHYTIAFPHEEYESGRPRLVSPLYDRLKASWRRLRLQTRLGAPQLVCARSGTEAKDVYSMGRQNWFDASRRRTPPCPRGGRHLRPVVLSKYELSGPDAGKALEWICANDVSKPVGRLTYTQLLNTRGGIEADLTVARWPTTNSISSPAPVSAPMIFGWIEDHIPDGAGCDAGRCHRGLRHAVADGSRRRATCWRRSPTADVSNAGFPLRPCPRDRRYAGTIVRSERCVSPMSANSAGNCMCR